MFGMESLSSNYIYDGGCLVFSGRKELSSLTITQTSQKRFCTWMTSPTSSMFQFIIRYIPDFQETGLSCSFMHLTAK